MTAPPPERPPNTDPAAIWRDLWDRLSSAVDSARHPFHLGTFGTVVNGRPEQRTVVLRGADEDERTLLFHTDARATKAAGLVATAPVSWLFYDPQNKLQLRIGGLGRLDTSGALADARWAASRQQSRLCYTHAHGPGTPLRDALGYGPAAAQPSEALDALVDAGRAHFAVVATEVTGIDWLLLAARGHRRMRFEVSKTSYDSTWIAP
ncbi:MAG: pyridoxamine 5'-phosphate oxidase family protein [Pseudomonadota bacterium]